MSFISENFVLEEQKGITEVEFNVVELFRNKEYAIVPIMLYKKHADQRYIPVINIYGPISPLKKKRASLECYTTMQWQRDARDLLRIHDVIDRGTATMVRTGVSSLDTTFTGIKSKMFPNGELRISTTSGQKFKHQSVAGGVSGRLAQIMKYKGTITRMK